MSLAGDLEIKVAIFWRGLKSGLNAKRFGRLNPAHAAARPGDPARQQMACKG